MLRPIPMCHLVSMSMPLLMCMFLSLSVHVVFIRLYTTTVAHNVETLAHIKQLKHELLGMRGEQQTYGSHTISYNGMALACP